MQTSETHPKILNKANKLRMTGAELIVADNLILSKSNKPDKFGITDITLYIELDNQCVSLKTLLSNTGPTFIPPLSRLTVKGNGKPKILSLSHTRWDIDGLVEIVMDIDTSNITNMNRMFMSLSKVKTIKFKRFDTSNVEVMEGMFADCNSLTELDLSTFDTSKAVIMSEMFSKCTSLKSLNLSNFKVGNLEDISHMFYRCTSLESIDFSNWDTKSLDYAYSTFNRCRKLEYLDISGFDLRNVSSIRSLFRNCERLAAINFPKPHRFQLNKVDTLLGMFYGYTSLQKLDLRGLVGEQVETIQEMFYDCVSLRQIDLRDFKSNILTSFESAFLNNKELRYLDLRSLELECIWDYKRKTLSTFKKLTLILKPTDVVSKGILIESGRYKGYINVTGVFEQLYSKYSIIPKTKAPDSDGLDRRLDPAQILQLQLMKSMKYSSIRVLYPQ